MKKLNQDTFEQASAFIKSQARAVDQKLFEFYFEGGTTDAVLVELKRYQNEDGGFGHGLEPDIWLEASSPLTTSVAFQYLKKLNVSLPNEVIERGVAYFIKSYDQERRRWFSVPEQVNDYPHAPWWNYSEDTQGTAIDGHPENPSFEIIGYLHHYRELVPVDFLSELDSLIEEAANHILHQPEKMEMHSLLCCIRFAETLTDPIRSQVFDKLAEFVVNTVAREAAQWAAYGATPLTFIETPESPFYPLLEPEVSANLDYEIDQLEPEGCWSPAWRWGQFEEVWPEARRRWQGYMTVHKLRILANFNRIGV